MTHYFDRRPPGASRPRTVSLRLPDVTVDLETDSGVFGRGAVDAGTRFLLRRAPVPSGGEVLDLGCGYGPIAIVTALRVPAARVWAIDVNERARALAAANAARCGAGNVVVTDPAQVPTSLRFDAILANPPIRIGLAALHPLLSTWLERLADRGHAHLVVHRHLGSDSLARWLADQGFAVRRLASHAGYRILAVQRGQVVEDDR